MQTGRMTQLYRTRGTRRRRRVSPQSIFVTVLTVVVVGGAATWGLWGNVGGGSGRPDSDGATTLGDGGDANAPQPDDRSPGMDGNLRFAQRSDTSAPARSKPDEVLTPRGNSGLPVRQLAAVEDVDVPAPEDAPVRHDTPVTTGNSDIEAAKRMVEAGRLIEARTRLNRLLAGALKPSEAQEVRSLLTQLADETVFSQRVIADDPLVATHEVARGEYLINIAREYKVPHEIISTINKVEPTRLRPGQKLKVPQGPFHARIDASDFRLDLYLQDTYVRSYRVGLGADRGTPLGKWKVKERLPNPTYYPPESATDKRIIPADDPANPLGTHWIGLQGIDGQAEGRKGYGIHGTIEPESIGKAVSMGCVRMHNEDVAFVYDCLAPGHSTVTTEP